MYTLAVIDMQQHFLDRFIDHDKSSSNVLGKCKQEITQAINDKANILFVEYDGYGDTAEELLDITRDADYQVYHTIKGDDNGGVEIAGAIKSLKLSKKKIKVCGINTEFCVMATVEGLLSEMKSATIEVIADACDSPWDHEHGVYCLEDLSKQYPKLKVI